LLGQLETGKDQCPGNTPIGKGSQGGNYPLSSQVADIHLKWSMPTENPKNKTTGSYPFFQNPVDPKVQFDASTYY
jgi:hypothetical protein